MADRRLADILIKAGMLDQEGLDRAITEQNRWGGELSNYLISMKIVTEETLVRALSALHKVPAVMIDPLKIDVELARMVPQKLCEDNRLICFRADKSKRFLDVALADPSALMAVDEVRVVTQFNVRPHFAPGSAIDKAITQVFHGGVGFGSGEIPFGIGSEAFIGTRVSPSGAREHEAQQRRRVSPTEVIAEPLSPDKGVLEQTISIGGVSPPPTPADSPPPPPPVHQANLKLLQSLEGIKLPRPDEGDDGMHITMDVPTIDKEALDRAREDSQDDAVSKLEAVVQRDSRAIELILGALVQKGLFTRQEIELLISKL